MFRLDLPGRMERESSALTIHDLKFGKCRSAYIIRRMQDLKFGKRRPVYIKCSMMQYELECLIG
jgi:hypothetical protein